MVNLSFFYSASHREGQFNVRYLFPQKTSKTPDRDGVNKKISYYIQVGELTYSSACGATVLYSKPCCHSHHTIRQERDKQDPHCQQHCHHTLPSECFSVMRGNSSGHHQEKKRCKSDDCVGKKAEESHADEEVLGEACWKDAEIVVTAVGLVAEVYCVSGVEHDARKHWGGGGRW